MSFLQRDTSTASPFAQVYHSTGTFTWGSRPNTATETWLSATGTNGYAFDGKGFVFGLFVFNGSSVVGWRFGTNVTAYSSDFRHGEAMAYINSSKAACDDIAIGYEGDISKFKKADLINILDNAK